MLGGANVQVTLLHNIDYQTDKNLAEGIVAMMEEAGIQVVLNSLSGNDMDATRDSGRYDWYVRRNTAELITVVQRTTELAPTGPRVAFSHMANADGEMDLHAIPAGDGRHGQRVHRQPTIRTSVRS